MSEISVFLIHNVPSPYRLSLFEALSREYDLTVAFTKPSQTGRKWDNSTKNYDFDGRKLRWFSLGPFTINYALPITLLRRDDDVYIVGESSENIFATFVTFLLANLRGKPFILWSGVIESDYDNQTPESLLKRFGKRMYDLFLAGYRAVLYPLADAIIAYSELSESYVIDRGVSQEDVYVGGQVMPEEQLPDPPERSNDNCCQTILFLGYLLDRKGVDILIKAFKRLDTDDAELVIAGTGPAGDHYRSLATDNVYFVGYVSGEAKAAQYAAADIFVLPTRHDPWGLVVNEAMYYELPVVVTEAAGASSAVDGNGVTVKPDDPDALASVLQDLLSDDEWRTQLARRSSELADKYCSVDFGIEPFRRAINTVTNSSD